MQFRQRPRRREAAARSRARSSWTTQTARRVRLCTLASAHRGRRDGDDRLRRHADIPLAAAARPGRSGGGRDGREHGRNPLARPASTTKACCGSTSPPQNAVSSRYPLCRPRGLSAAGLKPSASRSPSARPGPCGRSATPSYIIDTEGVVLPGSAPIENAPVIHDVAGQARLVTRRPRRPRCRRGRHKRSLEQVPEKLALNV